MKKQTVRWIALGALGCAVIVPGAVGCFSSSSDTGTTPTPGQDGSTPPPVGDDSGVTNPPPTGDGGTTPGNLTEVELDYMTDPTAPTITGGYWYTYSDRTCVSDQPPLIMADAGGTMMPEEGQQFQSIDTSAGGDPNAPMIGGMAFNYREVQGGGEANWGAGFGFDLSDTPQGMDPYTACPTAEMCTGMEAPDAFVAPAPDGGAGDGPSRATAFDVTADGPHKGIAFYIRSVGQAATSPLKINVQLSDKSTNPAGGVCMACKYGAGGAGGCADDFIETVNATDAWTRQQVLFTDATLKTVGWSGKARASSALDLTTLYYIHFQVSTGTPGTGAKPLKPFDIQVAHVAWLD